MKKKVWTIAAGVLLIGLLLSVWPWYRNISVQTTAYEYALDQKEPLRTHEVTIEGRYCPRIWRESFFDGTVTVSGFGYTQEEPARIQFWRDHNYGMISFRDEAGQPRMRDLGHIYSTRDVSSFVIQIFEQETVGDQIRSSWDPETGRVLCAGAPDYETMWNVCNELGLFAGKERDD